MGKIKKRFISMLIAIATIMTMMPIQFLMSNELAYAANPELVADSINELPVSAYIDQFKVYAEGKAGNLKAEVDPETGIKHYTSDSYIKPFYLTLPDVHTKRDDDLINDRIKELNMSNDPSLVVGENTFTMYAVSNLDVSISNVNEISVDSTTADGKNVLESLGIRIAPPESGTTNNEIIKDSRYIRISDVPVGVNKIKYNVIGELRTIKYTVNVTKDQDGKLIATKKSYTVEKDSKHVFTSNSNIVINNGTSYAGGNQDPISLEFNQFIGVSDVNSTQIDDYKSAIEKVETKYNNSKPLLYNATAIPSEDNNMQYEWKIKNSLTALFYKIGINDVTSIGNDTVDVYINGKKSSADVSGNTITGFLGSDNLASQDQFIVIGLNMDNQNSASLSKCYSIEIKYPNADSDTDYSLSDAGILKAQSSDDQSVKAYIGKTFAQEIKKDGNNNTYTEYSGTFYVDPRAAKISMVPVLISNQVETEFYKTITKLNSSTDREEESKVSGATMNDGFNEYYDFSGNNPKFKIDVKDKKTGKLVARYIYKVELIEDGGSLIDVDFIFDDNDGTDPDGTYLTTEGSSVKKTFAQAKKDDNRTTFNLYPQPKDKGTVKIALQNLTENNEYFKVWLSDTVDGNNYTEADESKYNTIDTVTGLRKSSLNINYGSAKRIVLQAYYDKLEDVKDENGVVIGKEVVKSYPLDKKYTFYLPDNITESDSDNTIKSDDASLNNIKVKGQTLYNLDTDKNGFSSDSYNYRVTVPKDETTAVLTVNPADENVKSITATLAGSSDTVYNLYPNEATELMLDSSGITDLKIVVTAQDGKSTKEYNLTIINNTKGGSSKLKDLILSSGDFKFDPDELTTKVQVESSVSTLSITPVAEDSKSKITVNGQKFTGKPVKISLAGKQSTEVDIEVESEDGESTTTYTLKIKRVSIIEDEDDGNQGITEDIYYDHDNDCWVDTSKYDEWGVVNNRVMYFDKRGRQVKDRWIYTGRKWYYLNEAGYRATGWKVDNETGQRYYMDNATGEMKLGMMYLNGSWYYLGTTGVMHTGWLWLNNNWYYFTENGEMITNQTMVIDGKEYRFATDGRIY